MRFPGSSAVVFIAIASCLVDVAYALPTSQEVIEHSATLGPGTKSVSTYVVNAEPVSIETKELALQIWDHGTEASAFSLKEILGPATELIKSIVHYVAKNPWILLPLLIPALELWVVLVGFESGGVAAGSIAAAIQSAIGNVEGGSLFAFLQSYGAGGFAKVAIGRGEVWITVAVLLAAVGKMLTENEISLESVAGILERVWNATVDKNPSRESLMIPYGGL